MAKIDKTMIEAIICAVGGASNIAKNGNCMTRLRLTLKNKALADHATIKKLDGVMGLIDGDTELQIVVGPGKAQQAKELVALYLADNSSDPLENSVLEDFASQSEKTLDEIAKEQKSKIKSKQTSVIQNFLAKFATIFTPLIPGFIAAGLLLGIATLLNQIFVEGAQEVSPILLSSIAYLKVFSVGLFAFLGILVGYNAQQAFGGTGVNGAIIASLFLLAYVKEGIDLGVHANFLRTGFSDFFGYEIDPRGNIIGILIATILGAKVEMFIRKFIHPNLDMVLTSTLTLLVMGALTYIVIMPIGVYLFEGMSFLFSHLNSNPLGAAILAGLFLISVMFGVHQGFIPVYIALVDANGFNSLFPILAMAGGGQVGAALALFYRAKKGSVLRKQVSGAIIPGFLGIGEPLIYGVTLPRVKPFITACIGGAAGGFFIGLIAMFGVPMGLNNVFGPSGILAIPFMTSNDGIFVAISIYVIALLISYIVGFIATYFWGSKNVDLT